jgi:CRISPR-associated endoribonuclease Cas6
MKEVLVKHYNGYVRGFKGVFELSGSPEILQFVYDYGFGIRTGQGFGLLELVKEL